MFSGDPYVFDLDAVYDVDDYLYFYEDTLRAENTAAQIDRVEHELGLAAPARVLDLGCGHGRHALELARRGYAVHGVDQSQGFVDRARRDADAEGLSLTLTRADLRAFTPTPDHDVALCLFDVFGVHRDDENERVLGAIAASLRPGGTFCLDLRNRDWMARHLQPVTVLDKGGGDLMIDRHAIDSRSGRLVDHRVIVRGGRAREARFSVRLYSFSEIASLLAQAGLTAHAVYGDWQGGPLSIHQNRMVIFGALSGRST